MLGTLDHSLLPTLWGRFGDGPFLFQHDRTPVHRASSIKTWMSESGVEELDRHAHGPDLHPIEHLWDGLERRLRARPSRPTSGSDLTHVLLEEWSEIPITTFLTLVERLPRRVVAVVAVKGGASYYTLWIKNGRSLRVMCVKADIKCQTRPMCLENIDNRVPNGSTSDICQSWQHDTSLVNLLNNPGNTLEDCVVATYRTASTNSAVTTSFHRNGQEAEYRKLVSDFVSWCKLNQLQLNISKTKEMVVGFRKKRSPQAPVTIDGEEVEVVGTFKYLGVHLDNKLDWSSKTSAVFKRGQSRLYFEETEVLWDLQRAVVSSMSPPVSAAPSADGCTTQDYMHTDRYHDCP
ncbi:hypothetical protein NFI96_006888 [Prochilodus magdalenae]|nr:hypothetical protein NFI96_006888 [Prochilodus magdalenae]